MDEDEGIVPRLNVSFPSNLEDGLEADAFVTNKCLGTCLGALGSAAYSSDIGLSEAIFVALDHHLITVVVKRHKWHGSSLVGFHVTVVIRILKKFENEMNIFRVELFSNSIEAEGVSINRLLHWKR